MCPPALNSKQDVGPSVQHLCAVVMSSRSDVLSLLPLTLEFTANMRFLLLPLWLCGDGSGQAAMGRRGSISQHGTSDDHAAKEGEASEPAKPAGNC